MTLLSSGDRLPPCGVPCSVAAYMPFSITPDLRYLRIRLSVSGSWITLPAHQLVLRYIVEELLHVYVHYPCISRIEIFYEFEDGLPTTPAGAEAVAVLLKLRLKYGRQDLHYGLLKCPG